MQVPFFDIALYARNAGFSGTSHAIIVALTVPESNRNPRAHNPNDPYGGSFGLTQINGVHLKPGGLCEGWMAEDLFDPAKNLHAAHRVWRSAGGFDPWGGYTGVDPRTGEFLYVASLDAAKAAMDGLKRFTAMEQLRAQAVAERDRISRELEAAKADLERAWGQLATVKEVVCP